MIIRKISPEENIQKLKIQSIAFFFGMNPDTGGMELAENLTDYSTCRAAFSEEGKMCSCLDLIPFEVTFDGKTVKSGGIGGVSSLPEERQKRYVRKIFENIMDEMYESGYAFSYLYPFSHPYYRKYGYELNMLVKNFSIPVESLKQFDTTGTVELCGSGPEIPEVKRLYEEFIRDKNLAIVRKEILWKQFLEKNPYKDNVYLYLWRYPSGEAGGYIKFGLEKIQGSRSNMQVKELIWKDHEAFKGILGFVGGFSSQLGKMVWQAPDYLSLQPFIPEPYDIKQEVGTCGMNRVVNAEKALLLMASPYGSGEVIIAVKDEFYPRNSGNYSIVWENSAHTVGKTSKEPDLSCDIQALSQLVTGFYTPGELSFAGRLAIHGKSEALSQMFPRKKLFINNYF